MDEKLSSMYLYSLVSFLSYVGFYLLSPIIIVTKTPVTRRRIAYTFLVYKTSSGNPLTTFKDSLQFKMASGLEAYINHTVSIITADGRNFIGTLKGFDQTINVILDESHERVFSTTSGIEQIVLGLHIIRGDNIAVIGLIDDQIDSRLDLANIRGEPLGPVVH